MGSEMCIRDSLKAVVTPTNKSWVFGDLLAHLQEEHATFTAAKETTQA